MYDYITGKITKSTSDSITIETGGIGYKIYMPLTIQSGIKYHDGLTTIYLSFIIREYSQALYGFVHEKERSIFELLLNVSGIGPKVALTIVSNTTSDMLMSAILRKDIASLCKIPGIGKKTAERMFLELKDSLGSFAQGTSSLAEDQTLVDAISALINLGYSQPSAEKAVKIAVEKRGKSLDLASLIATCLKNKSLE